MKTLPKHGRWLRDTYAQKMLNDSKLKKNELFNKNKSYDDFCRMFVYKLRSHRSNKDAIMQHWMLENLRAFTYFWDKGTHFVVSDIYREKGDITLLDNINDNFNDIFVDFKIHGSGVSYVMYAYKRVVPLCFNGDEFGHTIDVYGNVPEMSEHNKQLGEFKNIVDLIPLYKIHVSTEHNLHLVECHTLNEWLSVPLESKVLKIKEGSRDAEALCPMKEPGPFCIEKGIPSPIQCICTLVHVVDCYVNRYKLEYKRGKTAKKYNQCKVHIHRSEPLEGDIYSALPLHEYVKGYEPAERKEWQGGHHASPIEHERRGHYRKSRGKGDYDLVDGNFVYVGEKAGSYSYINPSHVGGNQNKNDRVKIYKV